MNGRGQITVIDKTNSIPWNLAAKIVVHHGQDTWEWAGALVDCLNAWLLLSAAAQRNADIFVQSPILGRSAIGPAMMAALVSRSDFQRKQGL
jgi:hypothetical protein